MGLELHNIAHSRSQTGERPIFITNLGSYRYDYKTNSSHEARP
jgi:hypothetical protein